MDILFMDIGGYFRLHYHKLLMVILLMVIIDYYIVSHCWLFY